MVWSEISLFHIFHSKIFLKKSIYEKKKIEQKFYSEPNKIQIYTLLEYAKKTLLYFDNAVVTISEIFVKIDNKAMLLDTSVANLSFSAKCSVSLKNLVAIWIIICWHLTKSHLNCLWNTNVLDHLYQTICSPSNIAIELVVEKSMSI